MTLDDIVSRLGLSRHPEGGWYRETYRTHAGEDARPSGTAIYYALGAGERSHWHHVDADEMWHWYAGAPLALEIAPPDGQKATAHLLGPDLEARQTPQILVPRHYWQAARTLGEWTLAGCTVSPGFLFSGFVMAPPGWSPGD
jgi:predicted cupin superfamily sugar epimerase